MRQEIFFVSKPGINGKASWHWWQVYFSDKKADFFGTKSSQSRQTGWSHFSAPAIFLDQRFSAWSPRRISPHVKNPPHFPIPHSFYSLKFFGFFYSKFFGESTSCLSVYRRPGLVLAQARREKGKKVPSLSYLWQEIWGPFLFPTVYFILYPGSVFSLNSRPRKKRKEKRGKWSEWETAPGIKSHHWRETRGRGKRFAKQLHGKMIT